MSLCRGRAVLQVIHCGEGWGHERCFVFPIPLKPGTRYRVDRATFQRIVGETYDRWAGLERRQVEFLFSARISTLQHGKVLLHGPDVAKHTRNRVPGVKVPAKALSGFVKQLDRRGLIELDGDMGRGRGGTRTAFRLTEAALKLTDEMLEGLLSQVSLGFPISNLRTLSQLFGELDTGRAERLGDVGEQLAIHVCLLLGLRVIGRNIRAPHAEIDVLADRLADFAYQRWAIQVKNIRTAQNVDIDRIDRELGAASGTGITHILFFVPRSSLTTAARAEMMAKNAFTPLHIYYIDADSMRGGVSSTDLLRVLVAQAREVATLKRGEAERREAR